METEVDNGIAGTALMTSAKTGTGSDIYGTPDWLFNLLNKEFGPFDLDPCADASNAKCAKFFTEEDNGLKQTWTGTAFINFPYSNGKAWIKKAFDSVYVDKTAERCVLLMPARTETAAWHDYVIKGLVFLLRGRLIFVQTEEQLVDSTTKWFAKRGLTPTNEKFLKKKEDIKRQSAPFPSAVVVFDRKLSPIDGLVPRVNKWGFIMQSFAVDWTEEGGKEVFNDGSGE